MSPPGTRSVIRRRRPERRCGRTRAKHDREALILANVKLAKDIALGFAQARHLTADATDELISEAYVGLAKAAGKWDARKGPFPQYVRLKVGFHLLDYVRDHAAAVRRHGYRRGEHPVKLVELLEQTAGASEEPDPDEIAELMVGLPLRERRILELHYLEDLTLTEIAAKVGVSPSRISVLEQHALKRLREKLSEHGGFELRARRGAKFKPGVLTDRQAVVLTHAAHGLTPEQSAERLGLHPQTIREHRRAAKRRLGGKGTYLTNTVYIATRQGLID